MATDPDTLPQYNGRPVPWITRWTNEIIREPYTMEMTREGMQLIYGDGRPGDRLGTTLWQREGITRGGEPEWAQVSTYRQRYAMRKCACQVCGERIQEKPVHFLVPLDGIEFVDEKTAITIQAPTCSDCIPLALKLCPHLRKHGYQILKVLGYHLWGVYGEAVLFDEQGQIRRMQSVFPYEDGRVPLGQILAKQQVIRLDKWVVEQTHIPEGKSA